MLEFLLRCVVSHRVRARSPIQPYKKSRSLIMKPDNDEKITDDDEFSSKNSTEMSFDNGESEYGNNNNNRVMVVVNRGLEAKGALQWALTHAIQTQDTVLLLRVTKPCNKQGEKSNSGVNQRASHEILCSMESMCQAMRPGVHVERVVREGTKEKGAVIVEAAKQHKASLLVLGKRKRSTIRRIWSGKTLLMESKMINYCIQNAECMTIGVRSKSTKYGGGYLITTKRHNNFWLLA